MNVQCLLEVKLVSFYLLYPLYSRVRIPLNVWTSIRTRIRTRISFALNLINSQIFPVDNL